MPHMRSLPPEVIAFLRPRFLQWCSVGRLRDAWKRPMTHQPCRRTAYVLKTYVGSLPA
jgi:hypothetical protein